MSLKAMGPKSHDDAFHLETALRSSQRALSRAVSLTPHFTYERYGSPRPFTTEDS